MRRCFYATHGARCLGLALVALPLSVHATEPAPPMVAASAVPATSGATYQMFLDAQAQSQLEVTSLALSTQPKDFKGVRYQAMKRTSESGAQVTYRFGGQTYPPLTGFEAVQFLVQLGFLTWEEGVGLVTTHEFYRFGPGLTQAGTEGGGASSSGAPGSGSAAASGSDEDTGSHGGSDGASGGSWQTAGGASGGGEVSGSSPGSTTPRGGARSGGGAAEFNCEIDEGSTIFGGATRDRKTSCIGKVKEAEDRCIKGCSGDSTCEGICTAACNRVRQEKCEPMGDLEVKQRPP